MRSAALSTQMLLSEQPDTSNTSRLQQPSTPSFKNRNLSLKCNDLNRMQRQIDDLLHMVNNDQRKKIKDVSQVDQNNLSQHRRTQRTQQQSLSKEDENTYPTERYQRPVLTNPSIISRHSEKLKINAKVGDNIQKDDQDQPKSNHGDHYLKTREQSRKPLEKYKAYQDRQVGRVVQLSQAPSERTPQQKSPEQIQSLNYDSLEPSPIMLLSKPRLPSPQVRPFNDEKAGQSPIKRQSVKDYEEQKSRRFQKEEAKEIKHGKTKHNYSYCMEQNKQVRNYQQYQKEQLPKHKDPKRYQPTYEGSQMAKTYMRNIQDNHRDQEDRTNTDRNKQETKRGENSINRLNRIEEQIQKVRSQLKESESNKHKLIEKRSEVSDYKLQSHEREQRNYDCSEFNEVMPTNKGLQLKSLKEQYSMRLHNKKNNLSENSHKSKQQLSRQLFQKEEKNKGNNLSLHSLPSEMTQKLSNALVSQSKLDNQLKDALQTVPSHVFEDKQFLQQLLREIRHQGINLTIEDLKKQVKYSCQEDDPLKNTRTAVKDGEDKDYQDTKHILKTISKLLNDSLQNWNQKVKGCLPEINLAEVKALDLSQKGHLCIQDLVCFITLFEGGRWRNRDLMAIWGRISNASTLPYSQLLKILKSSSRGVKYDD